MTHTHTHSFNTQRNSDMILNLRLREINLRDTRSCGDLLLCVCKLSEAVGKTERSPANTQRMQVPVCVLISDLLLSMFMVSTTNKMSRKEISLSLFFLQKQKNRTVHFLNSSFSPYLPNEDQFNGLVNSLWNSLQSNAGNEASPFSSPAHQKLTSGHDP